MEMKLRIFFALASLLGVLENFGECSDIGKPYPHPPKKDPCSDIRCFAGICWYDCYGRTSCYDPCLGNGNCSKGYQCEIAYGKCGDNSCRPRGICKRKPPKNPCEGVHCPDNYLCYYGADGKPQCYNQCNYTKCKGGYHCRTEYGWCGNSSCRPVGHCYSPCERKKCEPGSLCYIDDDGEAECENPCAYTDCIRYYQCQTERGECGDDTCEPEARCISPCASVRCAGTDTCYVDKYGKPRCVNPCSKYRCEHGYQCRTEYGECGGDYCPPVARCVSPCADVHCDANSLCYFNPYERYYFPKCYNACEGKKCPTGYECRTVPGCCGGDYCKPEPRCYPKRTYPPSSCAGIRCYGNETCSLVNTLEYKNVPVCGPNKCIGYECCSVRNGNGELCDDDACYLQFVRNSCRKRGQACQTRPVCRDPCRIEKVNCTTPGEYCYKTEVQCFAPPCPPIPECRRPCGSPYVCYRYQVCDIIYRSCITDKKSPYYDPYCKPAEICYYPD